MDHEELLRRLMSAFLEELQEHTESMSSQLLALESAQEKSERDECIKVLFRSAHTLKGSSRAVNLEIVEQVFHKVEDILTACRDEVIPLSPNLFGLLFDVVDATEQAGHQLRDDGQFVSEGLATVLGRLEAFLVQPTNDDSTKKATKPNLDASTAKKLSHVQTDSASVVTDQDIGDRDQTRANSAGQSKGNKSAASIRVSAQKLDDLLAQTGELLIARRRVELRITEVDQLRQLVSQWKQEWKAVAESLRRERRDKDSNHDSRSHLANVQLAIDRMLELEKVLEHVVTSMASDGRYLGQVSDKLEDEVHRIRMFPFREICRGFDRTVRNLASTTAKKVKLRVEGGEVEVDRSVLEGLKDPLLHLVRNAVDHGIESPKSRLSVGKSEEATVTVSAALRGTRVEVCVSDDGRGFDLDRIRSKAREHELAIPEEPADLARMVFLPGFSTAKRVTDVSGRGVGLDVVQSQIESLHGEVDLSFIQGQGTTFTLRVPLTLTMIRALLLRAAGNTYALPTSGVHRIYRFCAAEVRHLADRPAIVLGEKPVPLILLAEILGRDASTIDFSEKKTAVIVGGGNQTLGLVVDDVLAEQEVVVQNLGARIRRTKQVSGATLLASGKLALVLNVANLVRAGLRSSTRPLPLVTRKKVIERRKLLVVDDSVTTRTLLRTILETAGYDVQIANDGQEALQTLTNQRFDLLITDIDMPRMDGFELTTRVRSTPTLAKLPVILVTSRDSDQDKARGIDVGASSYVVKSGFDQADLLEAIRQLV